MLVERLFSAVMLVACLALLYLAWGYTAPIAYDPIGPRPYPVLLLSLLAVFSAVLAFRPKKFIQTIDLGWSKPIVKNVVLCIGAMLFYAIFFEKLGYVVCTILTAWAIGLLFNGKIFHTLIASAIMAVLTYLLFDKLLDVSLPLGVLSFLE